MSSGRVGLKRYIIPITFDIFKPMWSMCLLHLRSEDIISPRKLNSDTLSMLIVLIFKSGYTILWKKMTVQKWVGNWKYIFCHLICKLEIP